MTEAIIYMLFDRWCESERPENVKEAMRKAVGTSGAEAIEELTATVEKSAFEAGARACMNLMQCLFTKERNLTNEER